MTIGVNWGILICERVANLKKIGNTAVKNIKRILPILSAVLILFSLCACGGTKTTESDKIKVVCTVFPIYDWTKVIASDKAEIIWLTENGTDMHSFQPSAADMVKIAECDVLIYIGGESDKWIDEAAKQYENRDRVLVNLTALLGDSLKEEEHTEGMQEEHEQGEDETEYDEHVWLSLKNALLFTEAIADTLAEKDPENAEIYKENALGYTEKLNSLDGEYKTAVSAANNKTLLIADRFPFRYLTDDYALSYYAAFPGCSAETEASFETVAFLSSKIDELGLKYVIKTETAATKIAETVIANTKEKNQEILVLDSMQSVGSKDAEKGVTYLSVMEKNLETLKKALGE